MRLTETASVSVAAPPERVHEVLLEIARDVPGAAVHAQAPSSVRFTAGEGLSQAEQEFTIRPEGAGSRLEQTIVFPNQNFGGWLGARVGMVKRNMMKGLNEIKARSENRA